MAFVQLLVLLALIGMATAAPWRCVGGSGEPVVCVGPQGRPCFGPPSIQYAPPCPPCIGPAQVLTPCSTSPCDPTPSPCPFPSGPFQSNPDPSAFLRPYYRWSLDQSTS